MVGPGEKTGREENNRAHFVFFPFSRCALSCVFAFALSLACGAVAVISYRGQPTAGVTLRSSRTASGQQRPVAEGGGLQRLTQERGPFEGVTCVGLKGRVERSNPLNRILVDFCWLSNQS